MPDSRAAKKKELYKLAVARSDITAATTTCKLMIQHVKDLGSELYQPLFHTIVVTYARPFTGNRPHGRLPAKWSKFSQPEFQQLHDKMLQSRNQSIAHSDEKVRKVFILPPGALIGETEFKSGGVSLAVQAMVFPVEWSQHVQELCLDLGRRMEVRVNNLLAELYAGRELPAEMFPLTFDEEL